MRIPWGAGATRRARGALAAGLLGALAGLCAPAGPAAAHAALVATVPAQGAVVDAAPAHVVLRFSEAVRPLPGRVQVLAPDGKRITAGEPAPAGSGGGALAVPVRRADRPLGTYVVSYRVVSADGHPIAGTFLFSVGAPSAQAPAANPAAGADVHSVVRAAVTVARVVAYAGLVLLVGPVLVLAALWPRRVPRAGPARLPRAGPTRLAWLGVAAIAVSTLADLWLQAPYRSGAGPLDVSPAELRDVLTGRFGVVSAARLALLAGAAALLPAVLAGRAGRGRRGALAVVAVLGLATWPLAGHPGAAPSAGGTVATDTVHLGAMAVWLGGLVMLIGFLLRRAHPRQLALIMPAWSRWAAAAVCWLVVAGVAQAAVELGTPAALLGTAYGRLVVAKAALLAAVLGVAAYARRLAHRRADRPARSRLRWAVGTELGATAVVLALSAVLVQTTPGRAAVAEARAAAAEGFAQTLTSPLYTLQFEIYPVQLGENNTVHAAAYTPAGKPLPVVEWTLTAALPARGVEPATSYLLGVRPHQGLGAVTFPVPGEWRLRFTLRVSDVEQASVSTTVRVTSPGPSAAPAPR